MSEPNRPSPETDELAGSDANPPPEPVVDWADMPSTPLDDYHMVEGRDFGHREHEDQ